MSIECGNGLEVKMGKLYHYTSVNGFEGIIRSNSIRMTHSEFLNDPYDCHLFIKLVDKYLTKKQKLVKDTINNLTKYRKEVERIYYETGCDLVAYIEYIQSHIGLYVMSLTEEQDAMNMWNYYGNGGIELEFDVDNLVNSLRETFESEREFLSGSKVIYANADYNIENISVPNFSQFVLMNRDSKDIFREHRDFINNNSSYKADQLYATCNLAKFIDTYLKGYVTSMEYLLDNGIIATNTPADEVYISIFDNISKLNKFYYWKNDLSLYMLVLSALIKSDTYQYENEYRLVYFENTISPQKRKTEEYGLKSIEANQFLYPFVRFRANRLLNDSISNIIISPMTSNLPIDNDLYEETIQRFLLSCDFDKIGINYSKHKIRW